MRTVLSLGLYPGVLRKEQKDENVEDLHFLTAKESSSHSGHPCVQLLSVAGLLVIRSLFPVGREFIPGCERCVRLTGFTGVWEILAVLGILILEHPYVPGFSTIPTLLNTPAIARG